MTDYSKANDLFLTNYGQRDICLEKGQGVYIQDTHGNKYLDFSSGIAVNLLGHGHPVLVDALKRQADKIWHSSNLWFNEPSVQLAKELVQRTFASKLFFCNSGLEANEAALKLARKRGNKTAKGKNIIVSFTGGFHGRSILNISVAGRDKHLSGYEPLPGQVKQVPFNDVAALTKVMSDEVCAIMVEPVQGESGINPATTELLQAARELCDKHDALLIFDEIQSGMGRTGYLFTYMKHKVIPDLLTSAKGLASGVPIGVLLANDRASTTFTPGSHGSTFGGNALSAAVAVEVIRIIDDEKFLQAVRDKGELLRDLLQQINSKFDCFSEVRGEGLLCGAHLNDKFKGADIIKACRDQGLLLLLAANGDVLRFAPPLIIDEHALTDGITKLHQALTTLQAK